MRKSKPKKDEWARQGHGTYESPDGRFRVVGTHDQQTCRDIWQLLAADGSGGWAPQGTPHPTKAAAQEAAQLSP